MSVKRNAAEPGLWHYTVVEYLRGIMISGKILPATAGVAGWVKPAVWCSTNPAWEETANKMAGSPRGVICLDRAGTHKHFGLARIAVRKAAVPHTWADYQRLSGETRRELRAMEKAARQMGGRPAEWRCSFKPIAAKDWLVFEAWDGKTWRPWAVRKTEATA